MTEEEFYIWLLNSNSKLLSLPEFNPEFLKNYEIAKLVLDKFCIHALNEEKQRSLNFEAVSAWFRVSKNIKLEYDIPEILELLPERIVGDLHLRNSQIKSLPQLKSVGGNLILYNSQIKSLPQLKSVGGWLNLCDSQIKSLSELKSVGGYLNLYNSKIQSLPKLKSVGGYIYARGKINYWKNYFNETGRPHLVKKVH